MISTAWADRLLAGLNPAIQLHTGDPGPDGTKSVAAVEQRPLRLTKPVNGQCSNADTIAWLNVQRREKYTHFTAWDGGLLFTGTVAAETAFAGDNVFIDPGSLTIRFG